MATVNGARAIGRADSLGRISPGFDADLIAIPSAATGRDVFDAIVAFDETIRWMMVGGEVLKPSLGFLVFAFLFSILKYSPPCEYG